MGSQHSKSFYLPIFDYKLFLQEPETCNIEACEKLRDHGYIILPIEDEKSQIIENMYETSVNFFSKETKEKKQVGPIENRADRVGYIRVKDIKEYLKLHKNQGTEHLGDSFKNFYEFLHQLTSNVFKHLSIYPHPKLKNEPLIKEYLRKDIEELVGPKSSVSIINYFVLDAQSEEVHFPSSEHEDTGLLTTVVCSNVSALQMFDRVKNEYINVESLPECKAKKCVFIFLGTKIELVSNCTQFPGTKHQVALKKNQERMSMLYFFTT